MTPKEMKNIIDLLEYTLEKGGKYEDVKWYLRKLNNGIKSYEIVEASYESLKEKAGDELLRITGTCPGDKLYCNNHNCDGDCAELCWVKYLEGAEL